MRSKDTGTAYDASHPHVMASYQRDLFEYSNLKIGIVFKNKIQEALPSK